MPNSKIYLHLKTLYVPPPTGNASLSAVASFPIGFLTLASLMLSFSLHPEPLLFRCTANEAQIPGKNATEGPDREWPTTTPSADCGAPGSSMHARVIKNGSSGSMLEWLLYGGGTGLRQLEEKNGEGS